MFPILFKGVTKNEENKTDQLTSNIIFNSVNNIIFYTLTEVQKHSGIKLKNKLKCVLLEASAVGCKVIKVINQNVKLIWEYWHFCSEKGVGQHATCYQSKHKTKHLLFFLTLQ